MWYEAAARYIEEKKSEDNSLLLLLTSQSSRLDKMKSLLGLLEKRGGWRRCFVHMMSVMICQWMFWLKRMYLITTKSFRSFQYWDYAYDYGVKAVYAGDGDIFW